MTRGITFLGTVEQIGVDAIGIAVPEEVLSALGGGLRSPVRATVNGHRYGSAIGSASGRAFIPLSAEDRTAAQVDVGDAVDVTLILEDDPPGADGAAGLADDA